MNVLNKLTKKNLLLNKKRTVVTIIGIMLSTALVCAVAGLVTSAQQTFVNLIKNNEGDYHISFSNVPQEQQKYITQNNRCQEIFLRTVELFWKIAAGLGRCKIRTPGKRKATGGAQQRTRRLRRHGGPRRRRP